MLLTACSFSADAKKDFENSLTYTYKGCTVTDVKLVDAQRIPLTSNKVQLGATVAIAASGVQHFRLTGSKAYPGCELTIKDSLGKVLAMAPDILEARAKDGIATSGPLDLSATFRFSEPFTSGETYYVTARFFDKENPKTELVASIKLLIDQCRWLSHSMASSPGCIEPSAKCTIGSLCFPSAVLSPCNSGTQIKISS